MSYVRKTFQLMSVAPDLIPADTSPEIWDNAENILFRNGKSVRVPGDDPTMPTATTGAKTCVFVTFAGQGYWVYANASGVWAHDGTTEFDITPVGWAQADTDETFYTSTVMGNIVYVNASDRDPVYWAGATATPAAVLPNWPAGGRCLALRGHKSFLFAIGFISEGGQRVRWSDAAELGQVVDTWAPAADNLAGFVDLSPAASPCVDGRTLRDSFLIYKQESIWSLDFIGGNAVFAARKLFSEHGAASVNCITGGMDDVHLFVAAEGDVMLTDGVRVQSVLQGRAQQTFYNDFSSNLDRKFSVATLSRLRLGIIIYPTAGNNLGNRALLYDFVDNHIGFRDMPDVLCAAEGGRLTDVGTQNQWLGDTQAWEDDNSPWSREIFGQTLDDVLIGGDFGFAVVSDSNAQSFITGPITSRLEKSGLAFGNPQQRKMIGRIWPKINGRNGDIVQFRIGGQETATGRTPLSKKLQYIIGSNEPLDVFMQGRFLALEVESQGTAAWELGSWDVEYREVGAW